MHVKRSMGVSSESGVEHLQLRRDLLEKESSDKDNTRVNAVCTAHALAMCFCGHPFVDGTRRYVYRGFTSFASNGIYDMLSI
jgi:hypothetical protein